jgi:hypothetical protein
MGTGRNADPVEIAAPGINYRYPVNKGDRLLGTGPDALTGAPAELRVDNDSQHIPSAC